MMGCSSLSKSCKRTAPRLVSDASRKGQSKSRFRNTEELEKAFFRIWKAFSAHSVQCTLFSSPFLVSSERGAAREGQTFCSNRQAWKRHVHASWFSAEDIGASFPPSAPVVSMNLFWYYTPGTMPWPTPSLWICHEPCLLELLKDSRSQVLDMVLPGAHRLPGRWWMAGWWREWMEPAIDALRSLTTSGQVRSGSWAWTHPSLWELVLVWAWGAAGGQPSCWQVCTPLVAQSKVARYTSTASSAVIFGRSCWASWVGLGMGTAAPAPGSWTEDFVWGPDSCAFAPGCLPGGAKWWSWLHSPSLCGAHKGEQHSQQPLVHAPKWTVFETTTRHSQQKNSRDETKISVIAKPFQQIHYARWLPFSGSGWKKQREKLKEENGYPGHSDGLPESGRNVINSIRANLQRDRRKTTAHYCTHAISGLPHSHCRLTSLLFIRLSFGWSGYQSCWLSQSRRSGGVTLCSNTAGKLSQVAVFPAGATSCIWQGVLAADDQQGRAAVTLV